MFFWNDKNYITRYNTQLWLLYSGATGEFILLSNDEKKEINNFIKSKNSISKPLLNKLIASEALTEKTENEFSNIQIFRNIKFLNNYVLNVSVYPRDRKNESCLSLDKTAAIINFCKRKNQRVVRFNWICSNFENNVALIYKLFQEAQSNCILIYNSLLTDNTFFSEENLSEMIKLRFNDIKIILNESKFEDDDVFEEFISTIEIAFNFFNTNFYNPNFNIYIQISNKNIQKFKDFQTYISKRYGAFFKVNYCLYSDIYECPNKLFSEILSINSIKKYMKYDEFIDYMNRDYLRNILKGFNCSAQYVNSYIIDWENNVLKCCKDCGKKDKSVYDLQIGANIHSEIEFEYIMSNPTYNSKCKKCCFCNQCNICCKKEILAYNECNTRMKEYLIDFYERYKKRQNYFEI